jgi:phosphatidylglycerol---prolipoprotein diacylglyceryl transferase
MCSELFRIPYSLGGVPIFGFGVLLAIWAVASAFTIASLVRRHGWGGETLGTLPVLLLIGAAIIGLPQLFPGGFPVRGYGVMLLLGISASVGAAMYRARQVGLNPELVLSAAIWLVVSGIIGARLFYVIEYWGERFGRGSVEQTIFEILNFPEGGLVIYGGFIGAIIGVWYFTRMHLIPFLAFADLAAPSFMIGLAFGRIGCFLNGCCYGGDTDLPWAVTFPAYSSRYEGDQPPALRRYTPPFSDQASSGAFYGFHLESRGAQPAVVSRVEAGSPAEAVGLKVGDEIVAVNGSAVNSLAQAEAIVFDSVVNGRSAQFQLPAALQRDRRGPVGVAPVGVLSVPPPRRRSRRADDDDSPDHAVSAGSDPHRRTIGFRHGAQYFAEYQRGISSLRRRPLVVSFKAVPANRLALDGVETDCGSPRVRTGHFRDQWGNA